MRDEPVSPVSASSIYGRDERELRAQPLQPGTRASTPTLAEDTPFVGYRWDGPDGTQHRHWGPGAGPTGTDRHTGSKKTHLAAPRPWTPFFLRRTFLSALIAFFAALMVATAALFAVSNRDSGLASADQRLYYLWVYGPTAGMSPPPIFASRITTDTHDPVLTLIAAIWAPVDYRAKQIMPWVLLARGFQPARDSLLLDYVDGISFLDLFKSLRRRHWLVFSVIAGSFLIQLATVVSSGLFVSSRVLVHESDALLVAKDAFARPGNFVAGSRPATNVFGALTSNLSFPAGTEREYAFQQFNMDQGEFFFFCSERCTRPSNLSRYHAQSGRRG